MNSDNIDSFVSSFVVHYSKYTGRLKNMRNLLGALRLDARVITMWDGEQVNCELVRTELWEHRASEIRSILLANTMVSQNLEYSDLLRKAESITATPSWMAPRPLKDGEVSVLMKHFYALLNIALEHKPYGIIFEDDIFLKPSSIQEFWGCIARFITLKGEYLDIAGGASLTLPSSGLVDNLALVSPARTRTNACYAIKKECAIAIVDNFFPLVFPVDWHLQWIMHKIKLSGCYWAVHPPLIHGSEHGLVESWRSR